MRRVVFVVLIALCAALAPRAGLVAQDSRPHAPIALALSPDASRLYVAESLGRRVLALDAQTNKTLASLPLRGEATGLCLQPAHAADEPGDTLYITYAVGTAYRVAVVNAKTMALRATWPCGYGACAPVISNDGATLAICNRFTHSVSLFDTKTGRQRAKADVLREPTCAAATPDGRRLVVGNLLPVGPATADTVSAAVSIISLNTGETLATIPLLDGSTAIRGLAMSPDGSVCYVAHQLGRYHQPTTQLERGWMNTNALSLIDPVGGRRTATVLLDEVDRGAANPWAVAVSPDNSKVFVTHAGPNEGGAQVSVIDRAALARKLAQLSAESDAARAVGNHRAAAATSPAPESATDVDAAADDLSFLVDIRTRVDISAQGLRAVAASDNRVWIASYFDDSVVACDLDGFKCAETKLAPVVAESETRRGERLFADAGLCFQQWQSCVSCHPAARVDGLNWDLLNDGIGNPKNTKSLVLSHRTPPAMALGVRKDAETAVRSGIVHIQFAQRPEADAVAIDAYLKSIAPQPSPWLVNGGLSTAAKRGQKLFNSAKTGCASCHSGALYTDQRLHELGFGEGLDAGKPFDTPSLCELWRTAPYLHDGRAGTIEDVLTKFNPGDRHGRTSQLSKSEVADLTAFLESL